MREYLWQWMVAAVLCGVGGQLLPGGENGPFSRHWRLLCGVCITLLLIRPISDIVQGGIDLSEALRDFLQDVQDESEGQEITQDYSYIDAHLAAYAVEQALCEQFDIAAGDMTVSIRVSADGTQLDEVYVALSGAAIWKDSHAIEQYISDTLGSHGTVYIQ